ncbi:MAG TPA: cysteine desulfurase [Polyangiaceae bacterium]|jgi:cysteine desulfurase/selenocysteine lyase|nr:cysteine desulfurase [Polyangiaceae bacterium]
MTEPAAADELLAERLRLDFPALAGAAHGGGPLVYLDNAATTQKPESVIEAVGRYYRSGVANAHRGAHTLGARATAAYEAARAAVQRLIGAQHTDEIVLTSGCTAAINLASFAFGDEHVGAGDEVVTSALEHHSNLVPWQRLCERRGARLRVLPLTPEGDLRLDVLESWLSPRTRLVAVTHVANSTGALSPIREIVALAARVGARVLVDGAQAAPRLPLDVRALGCDFYSFSGHKLYGPAGIGALYARRELLGTMSPFLTGGGMVDVVTAESSSYAGAPQRFEAGTPNIEGAVGLARAIEYLEAAGMGWVTRHDEALTRYARERLGRVRGVRLIGAPRRALGVVSFVMDGVHAHDVSTIVDDAGVAVRAGHHCAQLAVQHFGVPATVRASFGLYNTRADVDVLCAALERVWEIFEP